uniref:Tudor domain-containing protein n=2 Tax=Schizaphis graminum TaxID=13262 RepID=A0A2S2P7U0_SCHGA
MVGDIVKVFSSLKKSYIRAKILKKNNDISYDVFYIDYGNIETIMSNEVYELSQELCKPGLAIRVGISDFILVENNSMGIHEKIKNLFEIFINTNKLLQIEFDETSENDLQNVKFKELENGFHINDFVMSCLKESESSEVEYKKPSNTNSKISRDHDRDTKLRRKLNNNDIVYLRSFQSDSIVYVIKDLKLYNEVILNTTQDKSTVLKKDLITGDIVKVISENCTYRAKIKFKLITDNIMVSVINIDTGLHHYVSSNSIYELSKDLIKIPGLSIRLKVEGLHIKNPRLIDLLQVYIKSIENIPLYVEYVKNVTKHQTVNLIRTDNSENIFTEFYKISKCKSPFICNEILNNNIDNEVVNEPKENLKIEEIENVKLKNGDYCIISFF